MVHVIKVQFVDPNGEKQIRRLAVSSDVASNYRLLKEKIQSLFQFENNSFNMSWKDSDNDFIIMSSDEELAQALANAEDSLLRVYVHFNQGVHTEPKTMEAPPGAGVEHPRVTCDGCDKDIFGVRYKCLQCGNYDLCSGCNATEKHADHDMIKLVKPSYIPREWVFRGSRALWRSMFGICPFSHRSNPHDPPMQETPQFPKGFPGLFDIKIDLADHQKTVSSVAQAFADFIPGGCEILKAYCPQLNKEEDATAKPSEASTSTKSKDNTPEPEEMVVDEPPNKETPYSVPQQPTEENSKKVQPPQEVVPPLATAASSVEVAQNGQSKEQSPGVNMDSSMCADDWTILQGDGLPKSDVACGVNVSAQVPNVSSQDVRYPKLDEAKKILQDGNVVQTNDPRIINALFTMQAMGFTNEGGWLERLLITKHGNINEALESLYPFASRQ